MSRDLLACPRCGEVAPPGIIVPHERWYACPRCGERTPRTELEPLRLKSLFRGGAPQVTTPDFRTGPDYPRPWCYISSAGTGDPILVSPGYTTYDTATVAAMSRFPMVTINVTPFSDTKTGLLPMMKALNPRIIVAWYDLFVQRFLFSTANTAWKADFDALLPYELFDTGGNSFPDSDAGRNFWVDTGKTQAIMIDLWKTYQGRSKGAAGIFLDFGHGQVTWNTGTFSGLPIDHVRAGYASAAAMDAATTVTLDNFVTALKAEGIVLSNGVASAASKALWTGELFENWPNFQGGASDLDIALAYISHTMGAGVDGGGSALLKLEEYDTAYGTNWNRSARYVLGAATLYGGYAFIGPNRDRPPIYSPYYPTLWADEFSVTPIAAGGAHDTTGTYTGWLGRPTEVPAKDASGIWVRRFTKGVVCVNGTFGALTVDLGTNYKRITGLRDVTVNNGATEQNVNVGAKDAVFLLRI